VWTLAHNIEFDDNKLMINKIKDFFKTKLRKKSSGNEHFATDDTNNSRGKLKERLSRGLHYLKSTLSKGVDFKKISIPKISSAAQGAILSPSLSKSIEKILSRPSRGPIHQIFVVLLISATTYALGKLTALGLKGAPRFDSPQDYRVSIPLNEGLSPSQLAQVKTINIFKTNAGKGQKKNSLADKKCEEPEQKSNLPIKLLNTVVLQDSVKSLASVQIRGDRELQEVRTGEQISNLAKIFKISRLEILVKNLETGMCESITSDKGDEMRSPISVLSPAASREFKRNKPIAGIENVGNKFTIQKKLLDEKLKDIASVLTQARAIKIQNPDGSLSFKMTEIDPEGIIGYLGIQDQDTITSINGKPIYDLNEIMNLFGRIKDLENLSLGIKREGSESVQEYSIKK
jgi:type II secretory pathway component PulC